MKTFPEWISAAKVPTGKYVSTPMKRVKILLAIPEHHNQPVIGWYFGGLMKDYCEDGSSSKCYPTHWMPLPEMPRTDRIRQRQQDVSYD